MQPSTEISIDLTAQELLSPPELADIIQVEDIGEIDPSLRTGSFTTTAASVQQAPADAGSTDDSIEIELTAEQIDALLSEAGQR
jgi:hypothetical protein